MQTVVGVRASLASVGLFLAGTGCQPDVPPAAEAEHQPEQEILASMSDKRIDCPGHSRVLYVRSSGDPGDTTSLAQLVVPGSTTNIPEFHDCQRLLISPATSYGPLVGIWASNSLQETTQASLPYAEVVNFNQTEYKPLGIKPGFNCLYIVPDSTADFGIRGVMVSVGEESDSACSRPYQSTMGGTTLYAVPHQAPDDLTWEDIPSVARWDFDPVARQQFIGIRCDGGRAWCELGAAEGFGTSPDHKYPLPGKKGKRNFWIKGWYDEQRLAEWIPSSKSHRPLASVGTVVPDSLLGDWTDEDGTKPFPKNSWVPAAQAALRPPHAPYDSTLGLDAISLPKKMNRLELCHGDWTTCAAASGESPEALTCGSDAATDWWARVVSSKANKRGRYFCVVRTPHKGVDIPGTARWRWVNEDETIWVRCAEGCCQVASEN